MPEACLKRDDHRRVQVSLLDPFLSVTNSGVETPGYYQLSLRDPNFIADMNL